YFKPTAQPTSNKPANTRTHQTMELLLALARSARPSWLCNQHPRGRPPGGACSAEAQTKVAESVERRHATGSTPRSYPGPSWVVDRQQVAAGQGRSARNGRATAAETPEAHKAT